MISWSMVTRHVSHILKRPASLEHASLEHLMHVLWSRVQDLSSFSGLAINSTKLSTKHQVTGQPAQNEWVLCSTRILPAGVQFPQLQNQWIIYVGWLAGKFPCNFLEQKCLCKEISFKPQWREYFFKPLQWSFTHWREFPSNPCSQISIGGDKEIWVQENFLALAIPCKEICFQPSAGKFHSDPCSQISILAFGRGGCKDISLHWHFFARKFPPNPLAGKFLSYSFKFASRGYKEISLYWNFFKWKFPSYPFVEKFPFSALGGKNSPWNPCSIIPIGGCKQISF